MLLLPIERFLFFLCLLTIPVQIGRHFWPDFSFIYSLPIDYLAPTLYLWDLLVLGLIIVWFFRKPAVNRSALGLLLTFLLTQTISLFGASNVGAGLYRLEQLSITGFFGVYVASKQPRFIMKALVTAIPWFVVFEGLLSLYQFSAGRDLGLWVLGERDFSLSTVSIATFNWFGQVFLRPYGTFPHPNVLGGVMVALIPLVTFLKFYGRGKTSMVSSVAIFIAFATTLLSFSRSALIVLFIEGIVLFRKKLWFLLCVVVFLPFLYVRFDSAFNFDYLSFKRREELAVIAVREFLTDPVNGIGLNNFINRMAVSDFVSGQGRFLQPVHNIYLLVLAETGALGVLGVLVLLGGGMRRVWFASRRSRQYALPRTLLWCYLVVFFLGLFDHYFLTLPQGQRVLFLIWGLSFIDE